MPERNKMENKIEIFRNETFGEVRITLIGGEPWFVAVDVCNALGLVNPTLAVSRLDEDEKMTLCSTKGHSGKRGGAQSLNIINEPGLYTLVLSCRKPEAKAFKRWITHEVLPIIRKTGGYMTEPLLQRIQQDPAVIYEFANALLAEKKRSTKLASELALAKPKADYFDAFINPDDCTNIRTTAKEMKIPERQFVKFLLKEKFLFRSPNGTLLPYNKPSNEGLFIVRDFYIRRCFASQTYFTPMGKDTIRVKYFMTHGDPVTIPA